MTPGSHPKKDYKPMTWLMLALIACCASCASIEMARKSKLDGLELLMYRSTIAAFMLLPFFMYMSWPSDPRFYVMMGITSLVYAWGNIIVTNLATRRGGRVAMMFQPLMIFLTFGVWLAIDPLERAALTDDPQSAAVTLAALAVLMLSLHFIRRNDYAWTALLSVAPVAVGYALLYVAQKWFLATPDHDIGTILAMMMLGNFGMVAVLPFLKRFRTAAPELQITHLPRFPGGTLFTLAALHLTSWGSMLYAIQIAANPAYPVAMMALCPVVFHLYYWVRGWRDPASPMAGTAMTAAALVLGLVHI
jgi:hypothetical protein